MNDSALRQNDDSDSDYAPTAGWLRPELVASWREIILVIVLSSGLFVASSAWGALHGSSHHYMTLLLTNSRMLHNLALESAVLGLLILYLRRRGWTPLDLKVKPGWADTFLAIPLSFGMMIANTTTVVSLYLGLFLAQSQYGTILQFVAANGPHLKPHSIDVGWVVMIAAVILNAFLEEIICTAYMFSQFAAKRGPFFALLLTVLVRMAYHTYQGPVHMLGIGAVFLVLNGFYGWTRNLWTIVLAHAFMDFLSFAALKLLLG